MAAQISGAISGHTVEYEVIGTIDEVTAAIAGIHATYPTPGYGTWFNWPPGGPNKKYCVPRDLGNGRWSARGHRSTSCD